MLGRKISTNWGKEKTTRAPRRQLLAPLPEALLSWEKGEASIEDGIQSITNSLIAHRGTASGMLNLGVLGRGQAATQLHYGEPTRGGQIIAPALLLQALPILEKDTRGTWCHGTLPGQDPPPKASPSSEASLTSVTLPPPR